MENDHTSTILLVDDDQDLLQLMKNTLERDGHHVETLSTAPSHADLMRLRPNLVFMDVELGGENGAALCRAVKHDAAAVGAVVLISGHPDDLLRSEAATGGADAFLAKPFNMQALRDWATFYLHKAN